MRTGALRLIWSNPEKVDNKTTQEHNTAQHSTAQHNTNSTQHSAQHNTKQPSTTQHNTAQHKLNTNSTQHSAQHNTTQHDTTHHNTTQQKRQSEVRAGFRTRSLPTSRNAERTQLFYGREPLHTRQLFYKKESKKASRVISLLRALPGIRFRL
jgi:hypothetical protein